MKDMDPRYAGMEKGIRYLLYLWNDSEDIQVKLSILRAVFLTFSGHILICLLAHISQKVLRNFARSYVRFTQRLYCLTSCHMHTFNRAKSHPCSR